VLRTRVEHLSAAIKPSIDNGSRQRSGIGWSTVTAGRSGTNSKLKWRSQTTTGAALQQLRRNADTYWRQACAAQLLLASAFSWMAFTSGSSSTTP
jgi:hypothetical protein